MTKRNLGDLVADEMNSVMTSDGFKSLFARPQVKTAAVKNADNVIEVPETVITEKRPANAVPGKMRMPEQKIQGVPSTPTPSALGQPIEVPETVITDTEAKHNTQSSVTEMINSLVIVSEALDEMGFEKSASIAIVAVETLMAEAAKKKTKGKKAPKKDDKKKDKKKKELPFFLKGKKGKDKDEDKEEDKKDEEDTEKKK